MSNQLPKIVIPKELPLALAPLKGMRKPVATLLMLKAFYKEGKILNTKAAKQAAATELRITTKTLHNHLKTLNQEGLTEYCTDNRFVDFAGWDKIYEYFDISKNGFHHIKLTERKFGYVHNHKWKIENVLDALAIQAKQEVSHSTFTSQLDKSFELKKWIVETVGSHLSEAVLYSQIHHYLNYGKKMSLDDLSVLHAYRADFNLNYNTLSNLFNLTGFGSIAYKKRKLIELGLIQVTRREFELKNHTTKRSRKTMLGVVRWDETSRKVILHMPDAIKFYSPNMEIEDERLQKMITENLLKWLKPAPDKG